MGERGELGEPKPSNAKLQLRLQRLTERCAERLRQELPELAAQALRLQTSAPAEQLLQLHDLHEHLHRLAGTAGTFGFIQLGEQARVLERQALHWQQSLQLTDQGLQGFIEGLQQLTRQQVEVEPQGEAAPPATPPTGAKPQSDTRCIYILQDELQMGEGLRLTLDNFGYDVRHFASRAALDTALLAQLPDALILDLGDPPRPDLAYAAALQQRLADPLPLLVITRQDDFATQRAAVQAGAVGYFNKPLDITQLENRLERCFAQQYGEPYRVLIVDDDRDLASRYSLVLRNAQMQVEMLHAPADIFTCMRRFNPEVLLLDVNMPDCTGPELAQIIRFNDEWLRVPIIYLSAETDIARQMNALLKAGDDFVTKPISDNALVATVFARAQRARLLSNALARDSLTGLLKHADIKEQVAVELERAVRSEQSTSVVMLDIDHFKRVNDDHGHAAGDKVIRALANLLRQRLRRVDSLGRYGGEEFLAVLPDCSPEQARQVVDEIREHFAELRFTVAGAVFSVTFSAGIAATDSRSSARELLERADKALYVAKNAGRNQVRQAD